ncbi:MAG: hypothetical protein A3K06_01455 [Candidatus Doudnabacteria bacterium RIFCSPHIGHO2_01_52_17]|uniref:Uncharacterized protein n=1 Tax=Candidatus Doudnabacteria bacterium RIFCSPHIGHO2_01_52_17 TaxID=1817820 RepID=A0A1F5NFW3_9BACT|nr:MAG: hypothetical protein UY73_C0016G0003 [Parcubacteria group bacterium GW2011_GWA2_52_8]OGE76444.1 MAG: hypothetical protein A3K06_01455 [Candidatus Doudnabacteria bacterium RIFCSPHIGHO2_01_52_17]
MGDRESSVGETRAGVMAELQGAMRSLAEYSEQGLMSPEQSAHYHEIRNEWDNISGPEDDVAIAELDNFMDRIGVLLTEFEKKNGE